MRNALAALPEEKGTFADAGGKWTIKEVLSHLFDGERISAYRMLRSNDFQSTKISRKNLKNFDRFGKTPPAVSHDVVIIGGRTAGLFCAIEAGRRAKGAGHRAHDAALFGEFYFLRREVVHKW